MLRAEAGMQLGERSMKSDVNQLTLLVFDGDGQERDEGHDCQQREEKPRDEEDPEAFQPGPPDVLQVHDVGDQVPQGQHT